MTNERRLFTRVNFKSSAEIFTGDTTISATVKDISLKGVLVEIHHKSPWLPVAGSHCELVISSDDPARKIYMHTQVAHVTNTNMIGLLCEHIDANSINNLRHFLEINLNNNQLLERELKTLWLSVEGI